VPLWCLCNILQELKSQQQELPTAVAALVHKLHWLPAQLQAAWPAANPAHSADDASQTSAPSAAAAASTQTLVAIKAVGSIGQVPGLTITSFHLQQLQESKQVGELLPKPGPHCWQRSSREVQPTVLLSIS